MKRRDFFTKVLISGGGLTLGMGCRRRIEPSSAEKTGTITPVIESGGRTIREPERLIPVLAETDVLVIGGGPAGVAAAIAASRTGAETYLVERYNHLGGLWTGGLVLPLLSTHGADSRKRRKQVIFGVGGEMAKMRRALSWTLRPQNMFWRR
jgi:NADPH-dependent 2,4-dienoyl-CoA reductase/sulfur reductase-like enzyme